MSETPERETPNSDAAQLRTLTGPMRGCEVAEWTLEHLNRNACTLGAS